jgi:ubiquinone/menaquinone biosynthesis C-methylase UbiE
MAKEEHMLKILKKINQKLKTLFFKRPFGTQNANKRNFWLKNALSQVPQGLTLLDAGAGNGNKKKFCEHLNYISQDIAQYAGGEIKEGLHTSEVDYSKLDIVSDIIDIPLEDESLDVILCVEVIEHVENPLLVFKEFSRLLKKDGKLILTAPFNSLTHYAPYHYSTGFNKYYYEAHLPKYGFEITEITANGNYFEYLAQETRRLRQVSKKYSNTKWLSPIFYITSFYLLNFLKRQSKKDINSEELLCFGYNLVIKKV